MRIIHEIHKDATPLVFTTVYAKPKNLKKASSFNAEIVITSTCPITKEEECIEIEGNGRHIIDTFEHILEILKAMEADYVADGKIVPRPQKANQRKAKKSQSRARSGESRK